MAKEDQSRFVCSNCGYTSTKWLGRCPSCSSWNCFAEEKVVKTSSARSVSNTSSKLLSEVPYENEFRFSSGLSELDRVLGGGIVHASCVLVGGEPGIGKSTLMLQVAALCSARKSVLYICGEESASQVRHRAERLGLELSRINVLCETHLQSIMDVVRREKPQLLIVDSLQTVFTDEVQSQAGSVTQMKACCMELSELCKANGTSCFFIGHVTKEGTIAGPKIIEHMVDTVLYFEEASMGVRLIRAEKNRFGSVDEIGIFLMTQTGLEPVKDPSSFFISQRTEPILPPGIAYTAIVEGSRSFVVEIQALVVEAKSGYSRVYSDKIDASRVQRVAAIMDRHASIRLSDKDIYVNVAGGVKVNDVSVELALAMALWSAANNTKLPSKLVAFGELSLAGEVRPVAFSERKLKAASDMGFLCAKVPCGTKTDTKLRLVQCSAIADALNKQGSV